MIDKSSNKPVFKTALSKHAFCAFTSVVLSMSTYYTAWQERSLPILVVAIALMAIIFAVEEALIAVFFEHGEKLRKKSAKVMLAIALSCAFLLLVGIIAWLAMQI